MYVKGAQNNRAKLYAELQFQLKLLDCYESAVQKSDINTGTELFRAHRELAIVWDLREGRRFAPASLESCLGNLTSVTTGSDRNMSLRSA